MPNETISAVLIDAKLADETAGATTVHANANNLRFDIIGSGVTSSGVVTLEQAHDIGYIGDWSVITTVNASDVDGGKVKCVQLSNVTCSAVRARISTVIGGTGTITVRVTGN